MMKLYSVFFFFSLLISAANVFAQFPTSPPPQQQPQERDTVPQREPEQNIDSLREKLDNRGKDSVVFTSKYIRFTKEKFLNDSVQLFPLDTSAKDFQQFNPLFAPKRPTINIGNIGLAARPLLFEPSQTIGYEPGYQALSLYVTGKDDIIYYQARSQYTELFFMQGGGQTEQTFHAIHSQNIRPNWNVGASLYRIGSRGFYDNQRSDHLNGAVWSWYQSPKKRYSVIGNATFNNLKARENGSIVNDTIFTTSTIVDPLFEPIKISDARTRWSSNGFYLKQFYNIGKIDSLANDSTNIVLPTQRVSYAVQYNVKNFVFTNAAIDDYGILKRNFFYPGSLPTKDSTSIKHLQNEFTYSFFLRTKGISFLKNEVKVDAGLVSDMYWYNQGRVSETVQNLTIKGRLGYRLSDRVFLNANVNQIVQGKNFGDFYYTAQAEIKLSKTVGKILLGASTQNKSAPILYQREFSAYHLWNNDFDNTQTQNLSFGYENEKFRFNAKADYYLIGNYLYFTQNQLGNVIPAQENSSINLLKISVGKDFKLGKFTLENYVVYQKSDSRALLRTPDLYTYHSFYFSNDFFKVLKASIGFDVRYFSKYIAPKYDPAIGVFYNGGDVSYDTYPLIDVWVRTNWKRANLFIKYDYANQGLQSNGYYTVNDYPMQNRLLKFGVSWRFYD